MQSPSLPALALAGLTLALSAGAAAADTQRAPILYEKFDIDRSGTIEMPELRSRAPVIFDAFDLNGDRKLDATEAAAFDRARGPLAYFEGPDADERRVAVIGQRLMRNDLNGDGTIDRREFKLAAYEWFSMHDRDGDGRLSLWDVSAR